MLGRDLTLLFWDCNKLFYKGSVKLKPTPTRTVAPSIKNRCIKVSEYVGISNMFYLINGPRVTFGIFD